MDEDIKKKYEEQTEDLYAALGKFAVEFEHICNYLRLIIMAILNNEGLRNEKVMQILLADLTADPLRAQVMSLVAETQGLSDAEIKNINNILNRVQNLTKTRNDVLHGTWYIGWAGVGDNEFTAAPGIKIKRNKKGTAPKTFEWKEKDFDELSVEAVELWSLLARLYGCISGNFKIENNFVVDANGKVGLPKKMYE
ncbi:MAG: hypothetical protein KKE76_12955 [Gammaproteobacteria bacterium]|nr:hypothetical protein [Gammaproteobacteria bacterium]